MDCLFPSFIPITEYELNAWARKLGISMTKEAKNYLLKYYNYDDFVFKKALERVYVRSYKKRQFNPQELTCDELIYYLEREPCSEDFEQRREHTAGQWCPTCRNQLELEGDVWKCGVCGYSIMLSDTKQGYGYPTIESTHHKYECMTCCWSDMCDEDWCELEHSCDEEEEYYAIMNHISSKDIWN